MKVQVDGPGPPTFYVTLWGDDGKRHSCALWKLSDEQLDLFDAALHGERARRERLRELNGKTAADTEPA